MKTEITAIIFNIDETLTNTTNVDVKCFIKVFSNVFGIGISNQNWSELTNITDWGVTEEIILKQEKVLYQIQSEILRKKRQSNLSWK